MVKKSALDWKKDSQSFDTVADLYNRYRPEYPAELVESVISLSGLPQGGRILEIGCGTGKATCLFARRGYAIHCIEPGANLAEVAARNLREYPRTTFEIARFEDALERPAEFNLVLSAQAFHWVPKEIGYAKAARALQPGGALALFWNMYTSFHGQVAEDLDRIYREVTPGLESPLSATEEAIQQRVGEIGESGCFGPVTVKQFPWSKMYQTKEYLGLLNTYSDHLRLAESVRRQLFAAIAGVIDAQGGSIERNYTAVLYVAARL